METATLTHKEEEHMSEWPSRLLQPDIQELLGSGPRAQAKRSRIRKGKEQKNVWAAEIRTGPSRR